MSEKLSVVLGENRKELTINGNKYELNPLTLGDVAAAEEYFGCDLEGFGTAIKKLKNIIYLIFLSLRKKHKELTPEIVGDSFGLDNMDVLNQLVSAILEVSGLQEKNDQGPTSLQG